MIRPSATPIRNSGQMPFATTIVLIVERLRLWRRNHRTRCQLRRLEQHRLDDIGLSAETRRSEAAKRLWME